MSAVSQTKTLKSGVTIPVFHTDNPARSTFTPEELQYYRDNGAICISGVFNQNDLAAIRKAADDLLDYCRPFLIGKPLLEIEKGQVEGHLVVRKIQPVVDAVPMLLEISRDQRIIKRAAALLNDQPILFEDKLNYKPPLVGSDFPIHHDWGYWKGHDSSLTNLLSVMIFFDDATEENGCMRIYPGSHKMDDYPLNGPVIADGVLKREDSLPVPCPAGSILIFGCHTVHCSDPNFSSKPRRALILSYHEASLGDKYDLRNGPGRECAKLWYAAFDIAVAAVRTGEAWERYRRTDDSHHAKWWNAGLERGVEYART